MGGFWTHALKKREKKTCVWFLQSYLPTCALAHFFTFLFFTSSITGSGGLNACLLFCGLVFSKRDDEQEQNIEADDCPSCVCLLCFLRVRSSTYIERKLGDSQQSPKR